MAEGSLPKSIGPYRVLAELGRGMMGVVYKARHKRNKNDVALKVIRMAFAVSEEQRQTFEKRFVEEAQIVARLDHPGIVGVSEIGRDEEQDAPFIAFEYLEGRTLGAILAEGAMPWKDALRMVAKVADALDHAHRQGVIHRDIKPANIMVLPSGEPKIMDFGLAKRDAGAELTNTGQFLGTPLYMSPEQALGRKADARTDIFSLACVAYTMVTGRRAFEADSIPQVMNKVTYQHPPRPSQVVSGLPSSLDYLLARAMAKSADDRHPTARALAEDVEDILKGRAPRHRAGWSGPAVGEGTVVSSAGAAADDDVPMLELDPLDDVRPRRRGGAGPVAVLGLSMLALGAVLYSSAFWKEHLAGLGGADIPPPTLALPETAGTTDGPAARLETPAEAATFDAAATPDSATEAPPAPALETPIATVAPEATAEPTPEPTAAPTATATAPTASPTATPRRAAVESSRLKISLEHSLKSGTLRVWVDKELVLEQRLTSRVTKDLLLFKQRSGRVQDVLPVTPGSHRIRIEVRSDGTRSRELVATFKAGVTRHLDVKHAKDRLTLNWK